MNERTSSLLKAAVAGIVGAAAIAAPSMAKDAAKKQMAEVVKCYGVNKCKAAGKCGGAGHTCAGTNTCKGQGWLLMPKDSCTALEGGSLTAPAAAAAPAEKKAQ